MGDFIKGGGWFYPQATNANGEKQDKMTPQETARELRHLRFEFEAKAANYSRMATAVNAALELIEEAEKLKIEEAQKVKIEEARRKRNEEDKKAQEPAIAKLTASYEAAGKPGDQFFFVVDGSGSMAGRPLTEALNAIAAVQTAAAAAKGVPVEAMMWTDEQIQPLANLSDAKVRWELARGLNGGSDLAGVVAKMDSIGSSSKTPKHFIIVSDGDVYDEKQSKASLGQLLGKNSNVSVDFVILRESSIYTGKTPMHDLADTLQQVFPAQVRAVTVNNLSAGNVPDTFTDLVQRHLHSSAAVPGATKKLPPPSAPK